MAPEPLSSVFVGRMSSRSTLVDEPTIGGRGTAAAAAAAPEEVAASAAHAQPSRDVPNGVNAAATPTHVDGSPSSACASAPPSGSGSGSAPAQSAFSDTLIDIEGVLHAPCEVLHILNDAAFDDAVGGTLDDEQPLERRGTHVVDLDQECETVSMSWSGLTYTVPVTSKVDGKKQTVDRVIVSDLTGTVEPGEMLW